MEQITKTDANVDPATAPAPGKPLLVDHDAPKTHTTGVVVETPADAPKPELPAAEKAKAAIRAAVAKATGTPAVPAATPASTTPAPATAPAEITDATIAAAADKAKQLAEVKAAVVQPEDDFTAKAKKAQELFKTDPLKAMELLGIPLDAAVKQAMGAPPSDAPSEADHLRAQIKKLEDEKAAEVAKGQQALAAAQEAARGQETVAAIIADPIFPNIKSQAQVAAALVEARVAHKLMVADIGRPLNDTEQDRLVRFYLKRHNDASSTPAAASPPQESRAGSSLKSGAVRPPTATKRTMTQVKADILARARK